MNLVIATILTLVLALAFLRPTDFFAQHVRIVARWIFVLNGKSWTPNATG